MLSGVHGLHLCNRWLPDPSDDIEISMQIAIWRAF